ncbi:MAG: ACP S-malonyltransferase [Tissierellia bacterium]|nr:ACP S-malonyltransferase [Tissierellia bacterium]
MKLAFIYSGQGAQAVAMGKDLYNTFPLVKEFYDSIEPRIKELSFEADIDTLTKTENTQPVMVAFQLAVTDLLKVEGIVPYAVAGLSIGEYSALYSAGVISRKDALDIALFRGRCMGEYSSDMNTAMIAVIGSEEEELKELLKELQLSKKIFISNVNTKGQIVLTGKKEDFEGLNEALKEKKWRGIPLKVGGPFHTPYMAPVAEKLKNFFERISFHTPQCKIAMNLTGDYEEDNFSEIMSRQVMETVRFKDDLEKLLEEVDLFVEIGHNKVLAGFIKRLNPKARVLEIKDKESFISTREELSKCKK